MVAYLTHFQDVAIDMLPRKWGRGGWLKLGACAEPAIQRKPPMLICLVNSIYAPFTLTGSF